MPIKSKPRLRWSLITFNSSARAEISATTGEPIFTNEEARIQTAITSLRSGDGGGTTFSAGLTLAQNAINYDKQACPKHNSVYMIFFIADGGPGDAASVPTAITNLLATSEQVYLSSAYYGPNNTSAEKIMEDMATSGGGKYTNFNNSDVLDFNQLLIQPEVEPWQVRDQLLIVYNATTTPCEDGEIGADSDVDFLCDRDEPQYGLDPANRFSLPTAYAEMKRHGEGMAIIFDYKR